jgi:hypothetical protein
VWRADKGRGRRRHPRSDRSRIRHAPDRRSNPSAIANNPGVTLTTPAPRRRRPASRRRGSHGLVHPVRPAGMATPAGSPGHQRDGGRGPSHHRADGRHAVPLHRPAGLAVAVRAGAACQGARPETPTWRLPTARRCPPSPTRPWGSCPAGTGPAGMTPAASGSVITCACPPGSCSAARAPCTSRPARRARPTSAGYPLANRRGMGRLGPPVQAASAARRRLARHALRQPDRRLGGAQMERAMRTANAGAMPPPSRAVGLIGHLFLIGRLARSAIALPGLARHPGLTLGSCQQAASSARREPPTPGYLPAAACPSSCPDGRRARPRRHGKPQRPTPPSGPRSRHPGW